MPSIMHKKSRYEEKILMLSVGLEPGFFSPACLLTICMYTIQKILNTDNIKKITFVILLMCYMYFLNNKHQLALGSYIYH